MSVRKLSTVDRAYHFLKIQINVLWPRLSIHEAIQIAPIYARKGVACAYRSVCIGDTCIDKNMAGTPHNDKRSSVFADLLVYDVFELIPPPHRRRYHPH